MGVWMQDNKFSFLSAGSKQAVACMLDGITHIFKNIGKRDPGSKGEYEAAVYMAGILKNDCGCGEPLIERFAEHPTSFYNYCRISSVLDSFSCIGYFIHPLLTILSAAISLFLFVFYFVLYLPVLDPLFPEKTGTNVTAVRKPQGEVKRRLLLNGHIDAAWEFTLNYHFGGVVFEIPNLMALTGVLYYLALAICTLAGISTWTRTAALWGIIFLPFFIAIWFTYDPKHIVDGANDNLSGCYMGIALLNEMEKNGISLENTEVGVVLTGSEEAGLRGAKAWSKAHRNDFSDVPTYIVSYDTIHDPRFLAVNERDLNDTVKADQGLSQLFMQAAKEAGVPCSRGKVPLFGGATDSAAFTQGGFRSVGITGLNHKLEDYYHTRRDSFDNLAETGLENCYKATVKLLELIDGGAPDG